MRRSGFTMVELIFVIVIIGILAATALPKFSGVKDKAKVNSELSAMSSLDGSIVAAIEFRADDFNDDKVDWHNKGLGDVSAPNATQKTQYEAINDSKDVLKKIANKTDKMKIVGFIGSNGDDINATGGNYKNTILFITLDASDASTGVTASSELTNNEAEGRPDKNDVWVFNPNNFDINVTSDDNNLYNTPTQIGGQSIGLVDVNGTTKLTIANLNVVKSDAGTVTAPIIEVP